MHMYWYVQGVLRVVIVVIYFISEDSFKHIVYCFIFCIASIFRPCVPRTVFEWQILLTME
jgi:hypothetical protein